MKRKKTVALKQMFPGADYDCISDSYPSVERVCQHWSRHLFCVNHIFASTVWVTRVSVLIGEQLCSARPLIVLRLLHKPLSVCVICMSGDILFVFVWTSVSTGRGCIFMFPNLIWSVCVASVLHISKKKKTQVWLTWGSRLTLSPFFFFKDH